MHVPFIIEVLRLMLLLLHQTLGLLSDHVVFVRIKAYENTQVKGLVTLSILALQCTVLLLLFIAWDHDRGYPRHDQFTLTIVISFHLEFFLFDCLQAISILLTVITLLGVILLSIDVLQIERLGDN